MPIRIQLIFQLSKSITPHLCSSIAARLTLYSWPILPRFPINCTVWPFARVKRGGQWYLFIFTITALSSDDHPHLDSSSSPDLSARGSCPVGHTTTGAAFTNHILFCRNIFNYGYFFKFILKPNSGIHWNRTCKHVPRNYRSHTSLSLFLFRGAAVMFTKTLHIQLFGAQLWFVAHFAIIFLLKLLTSKSNCGPTWETDSVARVRLGDTTGKLNG